jgi:hypothetical protein
MTKRKTIDEYNPEVTDLCERVLVTLLRHLGPWKESMYCESAWGHGADRRASPLISR